MNFNTVQEANHVMFPLVTANLIRSIDICNLALQVKHEL